LDCICIEAERLLFWTTELLDLLFALYDKLVSYKSRSLCEPAECEDIFFRPLESICIVCSKDRGAFEPASDLCKAMAYAIY
jgi:hypothetical protein